MISLRNSVLSARRLRGVPMRRLDCLHYFGPRHLADLGLAVPVDPIVHHYLDRLALLPFDFPFRPSTSERFALGGNLAEIIWATLGGCFTAFASKYYSVRVFLLRHSLNVQESLAVVNLEKCLRS
jgi:hypothetical protein